MKIKSLLILITSFFFTSCIREVQTEFPDMEREVVVNGLLVADEYAKIHLSWSGGLQQEGVLINIEDALVMLVNDEVADTLTYSDEGIYIGNQILLAGKEYSLSVQVEGKPTITASDKIPDQKTFSEPEIIRIAGFLPDLEGAFSAIRLTIEHDPNEENFFHIAVRATIGAPFTVRTTEVLYYAPFDPIIQNEGLPIPLFSNQEMGEEPYRLNLNFATSGADGTDGVLTPSYNYIIVELQTLSHNTFQYYQQAYLHEKKDAIETLSNSFLL